MSQYEALWDADAQYVYSLAGNANYTCIINGRRYWKTVEGKTLIAYGQIAGAWCGPLYVSTDPDYVTFSASSGGPFAYSGTLQYLGMTWYYSANAHFWSGNLTSSGGPALKMPQSYSSIALAAQALLEIANVHLAKRYASDGFAVYTLDLTPIKSYIGSYIEWSAITPADTLVSVSASLNGIAYFPCVTDSPIPILEQNHDYSEDTLYLKVSLHTDNSYVTPSFDSLFVSVSDKNSNNTIKLTLGNGNANSIQNAFGVADTVRVYVNYDGTGTLQGDGGSVAVFSDWFEPIEMTQKPDQMKKEHVEIADISAVGDLIQITYRAGYETERIEISNITAVGILTDIGDL